MGVPVAPSRRCFSHTPPCSRQLHVAAFTGCFGVFWSLPRAIFSCQDYPGSHCLRFSFLFAVSLRGCTCSQHCSWNSSSPELRLEGSRILPRMRSRVPVPAERWLHVTSPTTPQIKTHPPRSFAINRRILRECLRMAGFQHYEERPVGYVVLELGRGAGVQGDSLGSLMVSPLPDSVTGCDACTFTVQLTVFSGIS